MPVSFITNCKSYATDCKIDNNTCKFCQLLQSVTIARTTIWLTVTGGGDWNIFCMPWGVWLKTGISDFVCPGGGGGDWNQDDWKRFTGSHYRGGSNIPRRDFSILPVTHSLLGSRSIWNCSNWILKSSKPYVKWHFAGTLHLYLFDTQNTIKSWSETRILTRTHCTVHRHSPGR